MEIVMELLAFWRASPSTQLLVFSSLVMAMSGGAGWLVASQLRRAGLERSPGDPDLDWAALLGLLVGVWGLLLGGAFVTSWLAVSGVYTTLISQLGGMLAGLTAAAAIIAGTASHIRRRVAAAPREERAAVEKSLQPVRYASMLFAGLATAQLGLTTPLLLLAIVVAAVWAYRTPMVWSKVEGAFSALQAGRSLRKLHELQGDDLLDELAVSGAIGITETTVREDGEVRAVANPELLRRARAREQPQ
ncbi:MAG: hypothetical protein ACI8S6_005199 [Myxococcota bacterium]